MINFNCLMVYYTPAGHRRTAHVKTRADSPSAAIEVAEKLLRADKRRQVARVTYGKAIQQ